MANAAVGRTDETQYITEEYISELEAEMHAAAEALEFERAAALRDRIEQMQSAVGKKLEDVAIKSSDRTGRRRRRSKTGSRVPRPKKPT